MSNTSTPQESGTTAAGNQALLGVGSTDTTSGFEVTLLQAVDPWASSNAYEQPAAGRRFVAVELTLVNTTAEVQTFSTLLGLEVIDSLGQHWDITFAGLDLPQLGGDVAPGGLMRGWAVFEVASESTGLQLRVTGSITASGIVFALS